jgi:hypothetical protein
MDRLGVADGDAETLRRLDVEVAELELELVDVERARWAAVCGLELRPDGRAIVAGMRHETETPEPDEPSEPTPGEPEPTPDDEPE